MNWYQVMDSNTHLCLKDKEYNHNTVSYKPTTYEQAYLDALRTRPHNSKKCSMKGTMTKLKDLKAPAQDSKEHLGRVMTREGTPWEQTFNLNPTFDVRKDSFI